MNKFAKATKKIAAVATAVTMASSAAFAGGVNYPTNFVKNDAFAGQVIIGASATADMAAATSVIEDLKADFSSTDDQVKITATKTLGGGDKVLIDDSGKTLNYGEKFNDVKSSDFDDSDLNILADGTFNNGADDQDFTQTIDLADNNGYFEHDLRDDFESTASDKIYLDNTDVATYTLEFKTAVNFGSDVEDKDFVGKTIDIMGNEFTITKVGTDFSFIELIGGADSVTLGEGDTSTVNVDGVDYDITLQSVSTGTDADQILISVNGQTQSIDEYDTETVSGITIGVTNAFPSSRDSIKGFATLIVGGQKIKLGADNEEVKVNDKTIGDLYDNYVATSNISVDLSDEDNKKLEAITVKYSLDDDRILNAGDSWNDKVFNSFGILFDGINDVTYSTARVSESNDRLNLDANTVEDESYNEDIAKIADDEEPGSYIHLIGDNDDDSFVVEDFNSNAMNSINELVMGSSASNKYGISYTVSGDGSSTLNLTLDTVTGADLTDGTYYYLSAANKELVKAEVYNSETNMNLSIFGNKGIQFADDANADIKDDDLGIDYTFSESSETITVKDATSGSTLATETQSTSSPVAINVGNYKFYTVNDGTNNIVVFAGISLADDNGFETLVGDKDNQELYKFKTYTVSSNEQDVEDILTGDTKDNVAEKDLGTGKLTDLDSVDETEDGVFTQIEGTTPELALGNDLLVDLSYVNGFAYEGGTGTSKLIFSLDGADLSADDEDANVHGVSDFGNGFDVTLSVDTTDNEFDVKLDNTGTGSDFVNQYYPSGSKADITDEDSDIQEYVTSYGTKVTVDNQDSKYVEVAVPDKQVEADVYLTSGVSNTETKTYTVSADAADAKVAELEDEGYTVSTETVPASEVAFDVTTDDIVKATEGMVVEDAIVVGGPAINAAARTLLGVDGYDPANDAFVKQSGDAVARYFADSNSVLVYGYTADDTVAVVNKLNDGTVVFN